MIKSISYWSLAPGPDGPASIESALSQTKQAGFAGLEICIAAEGAINTGSSQAQCEAIRGQIDDAGVIVETVASGMSWAFNPVSQDKAIRAKSLQLHRDAMQRAAWVGADAMLFVPGVVKSPISEDIVRYDHALQRATEVVKALLDVAEKVGVDLCLENVWNGLFYSPVEFAQFVDSFNSNRVGVYFDVGNVLGYHQHPPHWIELLGDRIRRVHIKDFHESIGSLSGFCDLMAGDVPWPQSMAALRAIGYDKTIVAEMMPWDPTLLQRTSVAMDAILGM